MNNYNLVVSGEPDLIMKMVNYLMVIGDSGRKNANSITYIELDSLYFMILCLFEGKQSVLWQETAPVAGDD